MQSTNMTKSEKMQASKAAAREQRKAQTVTIDNDWKIFRSDPLNWEIRFKGEFKGYFSSLCNALRALPAKMIDERAKNDLADVLRSVDGIQAMIDKAIP